MSPQLLLTFLPPASFYPNPIRSFLQYLQKHPNFSLINLPDNLYTASEALTESYQPLTPSLQLQDGTIHPITIKIIPTSDNETALIIDLGSINIARKLIGESSQENTRNWLKETLKIGARMTDCECAFLSWETQPNQDCNLRVEDGLLYLETLPIILWTTAFISPEIPELTTEAWLIEEESDGGKLIIPKPLPLI